MEEPRIEKKEKDNSILYLLAGLILGGLFTYILTRNRQPQILPQYYGDNVNISLLEKRLNNIEHQLNPPNKLNIPNNYIKPQYINSPERVQVMENDENWTFQKDEKGKIIGVNVKRKLFDLNNKQVSG